MDWRGQGDSRAAYQRAAALATRVGCRERTKLLWEPSGPVKLIWRWSGKEVKEVSGVKLRVPGLCSEMGGSEIVWDKELIYSLTKHLLGNSCARHCAWIFEKTKRGYSHASLNKGDTVWEMGPQVISSCQYHRVSALTQHRWQSLLHA